MTIAVESIGVRRRVLAALILMICLPCSLHAQFNLLETDDLRLVYYGSAQSFIVKHTARCFENSLAFHKSLFDYKPSERVTVAVFDPSDFGNAGAGTIPWNAITLAIAPPSYAFETTPANERVNATMHHEIVHLVASEKSTGRDRFFRSLFSGKIAETSEHPETILYGYLTTPRRSAPRWYHEGIAVFLETWMSGGLGRALGSYDEMVFRTAIRDSARLYDLISLESEGTKINFQVGAMSYLYGGRFMSYLAVQHGPQKLIDWVNRTEGSSSYFASQFKKIYGQPMSQAWNDWIIWEQQFQRENLDTISQYPITLLRRMATRTLGSVSRPQYDAARRLLYVAVNYPGQVSHIAAIHIDSGEITRLCDIKGAALYFVSSLAFDSTSGQLFYTTDNTGWRDLHVVNVATGHQRMLMRNGRIGDLTYNPVDSSLWGIRNYNGLTTIVRIPAPYHEWNQIYTTPYGRDVYGLDISPDGEFVSAGMAEVDGRQRLVRFSTAGLMAGDTTATYLYDFQNSIPANFVHSSDGRYLYGTSYVSGASNVFRYDLSTQQIEALSNVETGLFNPLPVTSDSLIAFEFTSEGFLPVKLAIQPIDDIAAVRFLGQLIVEQHPIVKTWLAGSPGSVPIDSLTRYSGTYHSLPNLRLASLYPIVEGYSDMIAYGLRTEIRDPLNRHRFDATLSYSPDARLGSDEKWHSSFGYSHENWEFSARLNDADFYDLFGPTKSSRKGYAVGLTYADHFIDDEPVSLKYRLNATRYGDLVRLPEFQNITTSFDRFWSFSGSLNYANQRGSLGAVDYEKGITWRLGTENKFVNSKQFSRFSADLALGFALPLHHSAVWIRNSVGYSPNERQEPLANFYFGGFGNNWIDNQSEKRYRSALSFPGIELDEVGGTRYVKSVIEWTLPPVRFRHVGTPFLFVTWARPALFATALVTNPDDLSTRQRVGNVGAQLDLRMIVLSHLNMTLSIGYAVAIQPDQRSTDEVMVSLKVL